jgi:RodZ C-terminal domain
MQRTMEPNEIQTLHAQKFFDVITGNAQGIVLTLNGRTLKPLGHQGEVKKVRLTLDDLNHSAP